MKQDLINHMEDLQKELRQIENDLDVQFTSVDGEFHFFVKNLKMQIEERSSGNLISIMDMPLSIFESGCDWYSKD